MIKYVATEHVNGFKPGQEVPDELGDLWSSMYLRPPVKKVNDAAAPAPTVQPVAVPAPAPAPVAAKKKGRW